MNVFLRRRGLGLTSVNGIVLASQHFVGWRREDQGIPNGTNMVVRWGCTANIPAVSTVLNAPSAIHCVNDKAGFRRIMQEQSTTKLCPKTWFDNNEEVIFPVVVRPRTHAQGRRIRKVSDRLSLGVAASEMGNGWYASEYVAKVAEYRVCFVSGRVCWVAKKTPANPDALAWNVAQGGRFDNVRFNDWPLKAVRVARESFLLSGLDFGGVDVMVDGQGQVYVLEINSAPSQTSPYRQSCMAKCFDYVVEHGKESITITEDRGNWQKFIHPAISEEAILV